MRELKNWKEETHEASDNSPELQVAVLVVKREITDVQFTGREELGRSEPPHCPVAVHDNFRLVLLQPPCEALGGT